MRSDAALTPPCTWREISNTTGTLRSRFSTRTWKNARRVQVRARNRPPRATAAPEYPASLRLGSLEGLVYYVMPFVTGETLRDRLTSEGRLTIDASCNIAREVADALAYAHGQGVVHRDIEPENILLSEGHAVVADFGVARAVDAAKAQTLTRTGAGAPGTPAYMSPEQLLGESVPDSRSDIYSLGCVMYEMVTGTQPFAGEGGLVKRFTGPTPLATSVREDIPEWLDDTISKAIARNPEDRFQHAKEMADVLGGSSPVRSGGLASFRGVDAPASTARFRRPWVAAMSLAAVAALSALAWAATQRGGTSTSIVAVLPFANVGGDSSQQYLAEGMADGLATALGKVPGIRVVSRTVTSHYRGRSDIDAREIRKVLGADYVVHASLRRVEGKLRVSAQLISASDNGEAWSENYDRDAGDAYAVQDSIAHAVAQALSPRLASSANKAAVQSTVASSGTSSPEAYDLYLRGRYSLMRRGPGVAQAVSRFEQAIDKDRQFARAHAGLALALELLPYFSPVNAASVRDRAVAAANRALALDSTQAEAHTALGLAHAHGYEWSAALNEHQRAISLDPNDAAARTQYGRHLITWGG